MSNVYSVLESGVFVFHGSGSGRLVLVYERVVAACAEGGGVEGTCASRVGIGLFSGGCWGSGVMRFECS